MYYGFNILNIFMNLGLKIDFGFFLKYVFGFYFLEYFF